MKKQVNKIEGLIKKLSITSLSCVVFAGSIVPANAQSYSPEYSASYEALTENLISPTYEPASYSAAFAPETSFAATPEAPGYTNEPQAAQPETPADEDLASAASGNFSANSQSGSSPNSPWNPGAAQRGMTCGDVIGEFTPPDQIVRNPDLSTSHISTTISFNPFINSYQKITIDRKMNTFTRQLPGNLVQYDRATDVATFSVSCNDDSQETWTQKIEVMPLMPVLGACNWTVSDPERTVVNHKLVNSVVYDFSIKIADMLTLVPRMLNDDQALQGISSLKQTQGIQTYRNLLSKTIPSSAALNLSIFDAPDSEYFLKESIVEQAQFIDGGTGIAFLREYENESGVSKQILGYSNQILTQADLNDANLPAQSANSCSFTDEFSNRFYQETNCNPNRLPANATVAEEQRISMITDLVQTNAIPNGFSFGACGAEAVRKRYFNDLLQSRPQNPVG